MKYLKKFGNVTATNAPLEFVDGGWDAWTVNDYWSVETSANAFEGQALKFTWSTTTGRYAVKWEPLGSSVDDCEILARFDLDSQWASKWQAGIVFRGSGSSTSETGYFCQVYNAGLQIGCYSGATYISWATQTASLNSGEVIWMRARIVDNDSGDPVISMKVWRLDEAEPEDWELEYTDIAGISTSGWCGLTGTNISYECDFISFTDDPENESAPYELPDLIENFKNESLTDFTSQWHAPTSFTIQTDADAVQQRTAKFDSSGTRQAYSWSKVSPDFTDGEVLIRFKAGTNTTFQAWIILRGSGDDTSEDAYIISLSNQNLIIAEFDSASWTQFAAQTGGSVTTGDYYWVRARIEDTAISAKIWDADSAEPGTWTVTYDDTTGTRTSGWVGIGTNSNLGDTEFDIVSVAYGDDPAAYVVEESFKNLATITDAFTSRWGTNFTLTQDTDLPEMIDGVAGYYDNDASERQLLTFNHAPAAENDVEILGKAHIAERGSYVFNLFARASGALAAENCYIANLSSSGYHGIRKYISGSAGINYATVDHDIPTQLTPAFWVRFRVNGTSLKFKSWWEDHPEPVNWLIETTDSDISTGAHGHGFAFYENFLENWIDYFAVGLNGYSPKLPPEEALHPKSEFGVAPFGPIGPAGTGNIDNCLAFPSIVPNSGVEVAGLCYRTTDSVFDNAVRFAIYVNDDATDMSNAELVEDFGQPVSGQTNGVSALYFTDGPKKFSPGAILWIAVKSNTGTVSVLSFTSKGMMPHTGLRQIYTTSMGKDHTVAFAQTLGTLTEDSTPSVRNYSMALMLTDGVHYSDYKWDEDWSGKTVGTGIPDGWLKNDYFDELSVEIVSDSSGSIGGKYLNMLHSRSGEPVFLYPDYTDVRTHTLKYSWAEKALVRFRIKNTRAIIALRMRHSSLGGYGWGFIADAVLNTVEIRELHDDDFTDPAQATTSKTLSTDVWYWMRCETMYEQYRLKVWQGGLYKEPTAWDLNYTEITERELERGEALLVLDGLGHSFDVDYFQTANYPSTLEVAFDDFTGTDADDLNTDLWTVVQDSYAEIDIYNNQARAHRVGMGGWETPTATLNQTLSGDFTFVADYDCQTVRTSGTVDNTGFCIRIEDTSNSDAFFINAGYDGGDAFSWWTGSAWTSASRTNSTGKLAIIREGSTISVMYQDGTDDWVTAQSFSDEWTGDTRFMLKGEIQTQYHATDFYSDYRLDNVHLYDFASPAWGGIAATYPGYKLTTTSAVLCGAITTYDGVDAVSLYFEWGETVAYGNTTTLTEVTGLSNHSATITVSEGTDYNYRMVAQNSEGAKVYGENVLLTASSTLQLPAMILNPNAERGTADWTTTLGALDVKINSTTPVPYEGKSFFFGGPQPETKAEQELDLVNDQGLLATEIDAGKYEITVNWQQASYAADDQAQISIRFENSSNGLISTYSPGLEATSPSRTWTEYEYTVGVPINARYAVLILHMYRTAGTNCDGYIDGITAEFELSVTPVGSYRPAIIMVT